MPMGLVALVSTTEITLQVRHSSMQVTALPRSNFNISCSDLNDIIGHQTSDPLID